MVELLTAQAMCESSANEVWQSEKVNCASVKGWNSRVWKEWDVKVMEYEVE
jgi:hypothetical protein